MTMAESVLIDSSIFDLDEIEDVIARQYGRTSLQLSDPAPLYRQRGIAGELLTSVLAEVRISVRAFVEGYQEPLIGRLRSGTLDVKGQSPADGAGIGTTFLVPADQPLTIVMHDPHVDIVTIPRNVLLPLVRELFPDGEAVDVRSYREMPRQTADAWWSAHAHLLRVLHTPDLLASDIVVRTALDHLVALTSVGFEMVRLREDHPSRRERLVRAAATYMDAHLDQALTVPAIAAALSVSPRTLQSAFRGERDTTPMAYLQRARLDAARSDLRASDPTRVTVAAIAHRWGFAHAGRFASAYVRAFGEPPSATLGR